MQLEMVQVASMLILLKKVMTRRQVVIVSRALEWHLQASPLVANYSLQRLPAPVPVPVLLLLHCISIRLLAC